MENAVIQNAILTGNLLHVKVTVFDVFEDREEQVVVVRIDT
jgi:hypothetical protein